MNSSVVSLLSAFPVGLVSSDKMNWGCATEVHLKWIDGEKDWQSQQSMKSPTEQTYRKPTTKNVSEFKFRKKIKNFVFIINDQSSKLA